MLNRFRLNHTIKKQQLIRLLSGVFAGVLVLILVVLGTKSGRKPHHEERAPDFSGIVDAQFSEADTESAMTSQQLELESLKKQMVSLTDGIKSLKEQNDQQAKLLTTRLIAEIAQVKSETALKLAKTPPNSSVVASNQPLFLSNHATDGTFEQPSKITRLHKAHGIHSVSYHHTKKATSSDYKNIANYVPSGTFAKAVVLGGADADASVDSQNKNNGVMLFKIVNPGTLPNGKRSHLNGCLVTASAYGDISSERAYVKLDKLSCVFDGRPIVDKSVTGWAFFAGKVGIKGKPLMRDGKIVTWAGVSGAMSGVAQAAQYAQSVQSFGAFGGASSVVPSSNIGPFAAFGGASKAADQLSQYYIKRAEQYHPVIQVGAGNVVNIVFKDGFYLHDLEDELDKRSSRNVSLDDKQDPIVPPEVLAQLNQAQLGDDVKRGETP